MLRCVLCDELNNISVTLAPVYQYICHPVINFLQLHLSFRFIPSADWLQKFHLRSYKTQEAGASAPSPPSAQALFLCYFCSCVYYLLIMS